MRTKISWYALHVLLSAVAEKLMYVAIRHVRAASWEAHKMAHPDWELPKYDHDRMDRIEFRNRTREYIAKIQRQNKEKPS